MYFPFGFDHQSVYTLDREKGKVNQKLRPADKGGGGGQNFQKMCGHLTCEESHYHCCSQAGELFLRKIEKMFAPFFKEP